MNGDSDSVVTNLNRLPEVLLKQLAELHEPIVRFAAWHELHQQVYVAVGSRGATQH